MKLQLPAAFSGMEDTPSPLLLSMFLSFFLLPVCGNLGKDGRSIICTLICKEEIQQESQK